MKKIIIVIVCVLVIGAVVTWLFSQNSSHSNNKIFVSGNIEATEVDLSFRLAGQINALNIEEGDRVKKGQTIATLDTDTLLSQKGAAEAEIANAHGRLG